MIIKLLDHSVAPRFSNRDKPRLHIMIYVLHSVRFRDLLVCFRNTKAKRIMMLTLISISLIS
jgi:hypothetical protein